MGGSAVSDTGSVATGFGGRLVQELGVLGCLVNGGSLVFLKVQLVLVVESLSLEDILLLLLFSLEEFLGGKRKGGNEGS